MKTARWTGIALLSFLAVSAVTGSVPMIANPRGQPWQMPQALLQHSPFHSYLVPGVVLLVANGLLAAWALWLALARAPRYARWMTLQGCVLFAWLAVECILLRMAVWPHYLYAAIAIALVGAGLLLGRAEKQSVPLASERALTNGRSLIGGNPFGDGI